ncbi:hypothetical protein KPH14_004178 [Odynerus spinipes]|uniref:Ionotropic receptor n=1 Tax=Odynerus spinipes TaxID=1348599 RepID=A0AAD9VW39_9HYME|nr:hypothetical protein KPH14_004178 [Odynerus spinipes]
MIFRFVLMLGTLLWMFENGRAAGGVIWSKDRENFVQLDSVRRFAEFQAEIRKESREREKYHFNGEVINLLIQQQKSGLYITENSTSIRIWRILEEILNITLRINFLKEVKTAEELLQFMERNNSHIIQPILYNTSSMELFHFNIPYFILRHSLHVQPQWHYEFCWIFTLFSRSSWSYIVILFVAFSLINFVFQKISRERSGDDAASNFNLSDHFFYTLGAVCAQGYIPTDYTKKFKILHLAKQIFALLLSNYFGSVLIYHLSTAIQTAPFEDIASLLIDTNYTILTTSKISLRQIIKRQNPTFLEKTGISQRALTDRIHFTEDIHWIVEKVCLPGSKYAWYGVSRQLVSIPELPCNIMSLKKTRFDFFVTSAMAKNSPYKKTIDIAIMRVREVGLAKYWVQHFYPNNQIWKPSNSFMYITLEQVRMIFFILWGGTIASLLILAIERVVFSYHSKRNGDGR